MVSCLQDFRFKLYMHLRFLYCKKYRTYELLVFYVALRASRISSLSLLDLIICGEKHKLWSSSLRSFHQPPPCYVWTFPQHNVLIHHFIKARDNISLLWKATDKKATLIDVRMAFKTYSTHLGRQ
jgi:hypothetical protein